MAAAGFNGHVGLDEEGWGSGQERTFWRSDNARRMNVAVVNTVSPAVTYRSREKWSASLTNVVTMLPDDQSATTKVNTETGIGIFCHLER